MNDCQFCGVMAGCLHTTECSIWQRANPNNPANPKLIIMFLPYQEIQFEDKTNWAYEYGFIEDRIETYPPAISQCSKKIGAYLGTDDSGYVKLENRIPMTAKPRRTVTLHVASYAMIGPDLYFTYLTYIYGRYGRNGHIIEGFDARPKQFFPPRPKKDKQWTTDFNYGRVVFSIKTKQG